MSDRSFARSAGDPKSSARLCPEPYDPTFFLWSDGYLHSVSQDLTSGVVEGAGRFVSLCENADGQADNWENPRRVRRMRRSITCKLA